MVASTPVQSASPAATPMTLASRRLIRKRPFIAVPSVSRSSGDRQRGCGRNEQKRGDEGAGEQGGGLTGGNESGEHWKTPLSFLPNPTIGSVPLAMQGPCQLKKVL